MRFLRVAYRGREFPH